SCCYPIFPYTFLSNDAASTEIYTLSLHDALPIYDDGLSYYCRNCEVGRCRVWNRQQPSEYWIWLNMKDRCYNSKRPCFKYSNDRSEEHTSELQSLTNLVCRLLLEKKNKRNNHECH